MRKVDLTAGQIEVVFTQFVHAYRGTLEKNQKRIVEGSMLVKDVADTAFGNLPKGVRDEAQLIFGTIDKKTKIKVVAEKCCRDGDLVPA